MKELKCALVEHQATLAMRMFERERGRERGGVVQGSPQQARASSLLDLQCSQDKAWTAYPTRMYDGSAWIMDGVYGVLETSFDQCQHMDVWFYTRQVSWNRTRTIQMSQQLDVPERDPLDKTMTPLWNQREPSVKWLGTPERARWLLHICCKQGKETYLQLHNGFTKL